MGRGSSKVGGGGNITKINVSPLTAMKENAKQLSDAKREAKAAGAAEIQYTDMNGKEYKLYWDGARYQDRKSAMAQKYSNMSGIYKKKFKKPNDW